MYIAVNDKLEEIQNQINKIEDEDSNYTQNEKWIELRHLQDSLYKFKKREMKNDNSIEIR